MAAGIPLGGFGVLLCDPPWRFETYSDRGQEKSASQHYATMSLSELIGLGRDLQLDFAMAPDCVCTMWACWPNLQDAMALMKAWGFAYKTGGAWAKQSKSGRRWHFGTGYIYRGATELWLLGTRGAPTILSHSERNLIVAPVREHSRKPDDMHVAIERQFKGPYLELFGRQPREGWTVWGDQADRFTGAAA